MILFESPKRKIPMDYDEYVAKAVKELRKRVPTLNARLPVEVKNDGSALFHCDTQNPTDPSLPWVSFPVAIKRNVFAPNCPLIDLPANIPAAKLSEEKTITLRIAYCIFQALREAQKVINKIGEKKP